jgi:hypothetical protein
MIDERRDQKEVVMSTHSSGDQHPATIAKLEQITDPEKLLSTSARISAAAEAEMNDAPEGGLSMMDRRNKAFSALHYLFDRAKMRIADEAGLDRRMVNHALDGQPVDQRKIPKLPDMTEEDAIAQAKESTAKLKQVAADALSERKEPRLPGKTTRELTTAIRVLYFVYGKSDDRPDGWTKARISNRLRIPRPWLRDALDPVLRAMYGFGDVDEATAERDALELSAKVKELREIKLTAARICKETGRAAMNGEFGDPLSNKRVCDLTGLTSPTVSQWRTGTSNEWKRRQRRAGALTG